MPSSPRARSSMASVPDLRSCTSACRALFRASKASLVSCCAATFFCSSCTRIHPPFPHQSGYWVRTVSRARTMSRSRIFYQKQPGQAGLLLPPKFLAQIIEGVTAGIRGHFSKLFFDTEQLVVFGHAVGTRQRTRLDLHSIGGHGNIGNRGIFGFARAVGNDRGITGRLGPFNGGKRFGSGTDLNNFVDDGIFNTLCIVFVRGK